MNEILTAARLSDGHGHVCFPDRKICASHKCMSFIKLHKLIVLGMTEE